MLSSCVRASVSFIESCFRAQKPTVHKIRQFDFCYIKGSMVLVTCGAALNCLLHFLYVLHSTFLRTSVVKSVAMGLRNISKFLGVGPNFHAFNESRQPWMGSAPIKITAVRIALLQPRVSILPRFTYKYQPTTYLAVY